MENKTLKIVVVSILIMLFNFGCKPKDCHKDGTCAEDYRRMPLGEAKEYLYSLPGSYWIYKNTSTGDLDTQVCIGFICDTIIIKGTENFSRHITFEYERIKRVIKSSYNKNVIYEQTAGYNPNAPRSLEAILERDVNGTIKAFFYPFTLGEKISKGISNTTCIGIDTTLTIQGKLYYNIAKFELDIDGTWENSPPFTGSQYYWAKYVGLVKRLAINRNDEWEILSYEIIK
jgi:hypothetical protein